MLAKAAVGLRFPLQYDRLAMIVGAHHILIIEYVAEKIDGRPLLRLLQRNADTDPYDVRSCG